MLRIAPLIAFVAVAVSPIQTSADGGPPIVAVMNVQVKGVKLSADAVDRLTDLLTGRLGSTGRFQVVPREQVKARLIEMKKGSYKECYAQSCQIELGQALAAQKTVAMQVVKVGSRCTAILNVFDLKREASEEGSSIDGSCDEEGIAVSLGAAVSRVGGEQAIPEGSARVSAPKLAPIMTETGRVGEEAHATGTSVAPFPSRVAPIATGSVPSNLKISEDQWRALLRYMGEDRARDIVSEYYEVVARDFAAVGMADGIDEYLDKRRSTWKQHRDGGVGATAVGLAMVATGFGLFGAGFGYPSSNYGDRLAVSGLVFWPIGIAMVIIGGPIWGVYQSRLDELDACREAGRAGTPSLRWSGLTPVYDPLSRTQGAAVSFSY